MEMVPLNVDDPRAIVETGACGRSLACTVESAFPFRARVALQSDRCMLGYLHRTNEGSWCHGLPLATDSAFLVFPDHPAEFLFAAQTRLTMMLVPHRQVRETLRYLSRFSTETSPRLHPVHRPDKLAARQRLKEVYEAVGSQDGTASPMHAADRRSTSSPSVDELLATHLAGNLSATANDLPKESRGRHRHFLIVQRTEQFMLRHLRSDIYVREMCMAAGVSERALRYAFEDLLGISPNRYLSMLRLCTACRSLASSDASRRSVKSVALSCGLWDLSRFADSYRRVFGELPRNTLMRSPVTAAC